MSVASWKSSYVKWKNYFEMITYDFASKFIIEKNVTANLNLGIEDLAKSLNLPLEVHEITTQDGYIIQVHRLVGSGPPVLLMHGMMVSSMAWLSSGEESLGNQLHKAGYDVWLGNVRGGRYGSKHTHLSNDDPEFWRFTFHEMGTQDIPAILDKIVTLTGIPQINCIGHCMGATALLITASSCEQAQKRIGRTVLLCPVALISDKQYSLLSSANIKRIENLLTNWIGLQTLLFKIPGLNLLMERPLFPVISDNIMNHFMGPSGSTLTKNLSVVLVSNSSIYTMLHYMQIVSEKKFCSYNWDTLPASVEYDLSKITNNTTIFLSSNDSLAPPCLATEYQKAFSCINDIRIVDVTHIGFIWGKKANNLVYNPIIQILREATQLNAITSHLIKEGTENKAIECETRKLPENLEFVKQENNKKDEIRKGDRDEIQEKKGYHVGVSNQEVTPIRKDQDMTLKHIYKGIQQTDVNVLSLEVTPIRKDQDMTLKHIDKGIQQTNGTMDKSQIHQKLEAKIPKVELVNTICLEHQNKTDNASVEAAQKDITKLSESLDSLKLSPVRDKKRSNVAGNACTTANPPKLGVVTQKKKVLPLQGEYEMKDQQHERGIVDGDQRRGGLLYNRSNDIRPGGSSLGVGNLRRYGSGFQNGESRGGNLQASLRKKAKEHKI